MQAVSSKLDKLAQAEPTERQSHLGETEYDHDYEDPAAKSSKSSEPAPKRGKSARITAGGKTEGPQQADRHAHEGDRAKCHDSNDERYMEQDDDKKDTGHKSLASRGRLSPAGLAWPTRSPRGK